MQRILRSRTSRIRSHTEACRAGQLSAPDAAGTTPTIGVATLAPAFGQALPSLADVRAEYNHEINAELVYELSAALVREGLGTSETWNKSGGNALAFAQHTMKSAIGPERGDLLQRNVEYHLEVSDQLGRAGSDAELGSGQLVVTVECGGSGYFRIGSALDALEAEAEGLGAAFYWTLTFALYRVMWISETNCVRQPFSVSDIGQNKATVLINRINLFWGTRWRAEPTYFDEQTFDRINDRSIDLLIGCVDTRAARSVIANALTKGRNRTAYWLDLGNNAASGQFVLGQPLNARNRRKAARLRTVSELYPEIIDAETGEDPLPSCSAVEALDRQEPFINQTLAASALAMLARLFRYGKLSHHGGFYSAQSNQICGLPVDPQLWSRTRRRARQL